MKYFLTVPLQKGVDFYNLEQLLDQLDYGNWIADQYPGGYQPGQYFRQEQCQRIKILMDQEKFVFNLILLM